MTVKLYISMLISSLLFNGIIFIMLRKEILDLKYSLTWLAAGLGLIVIAIWPKSTSYLANLLGIIEPVNAIFFMGIAFSLVIILSLAVALTRQSNRIRRIAQELALLEKKFNEMKE